MKAKIPKKKAVKSMKKRFCGCWTCGFELRRSWRSKRLGYFEKKESDDILRGIYYFPSFAQEHPKK